MLKNENIICISSIDWDFIWQGHQEIMSAYAKSSNRVLFIENTGIRSPTFKDIPRIRKRIANWFASVKGFRKEAENLYIYSPIILPFPYSRVAAFFNRFFMMKALRRWMEIMDFANPIVWTFLPTETALDIIKGVNAKALIYYFIADFGQLTTSYKKLRKAENRLMKRCDVIFVQGERFKERCLEFKKQVFVFPFGVNTEVFEKFKKGRPGGIPEDLKGIRRPIVGYVGGIHRHIDFDLIREMALAHPEWSIVMAGPVQTKAPQIERLENVHLIGKKAFEELPAYIDQFDVGIVPYVLSEYTKTVYPTKINEYHIMGKPVVSTPLPEVLKANEDELVFVAKEKGEFIDKVKAALEGDKDNLREARRREAAKNSWISRIEEMSAKIEEIVRKRTEARVGWQERFLDIYRRSRRKIIRVALAILLLSAIVFYTPLVWYMAEPLSISQPPRYSDAVVVFAGGVGESGKAGQGYEERVGYAVELYKKGYAKNLVFSSGSRAAFPETYIMKALAVFLGVPGEAILLEDSSTSTYENVKFTSGILNKNRWHKIVLVSSPYHMLRASLVFKKIAPDIDVVYSPVPQSQFYRHGVNSKGEKIWRQASLTQIKAVLHEYAAILYYLLKGWI